METIPKTPWDVMGCQVATCLEALKRGVMNGGSGVSIGGVGSLRVLSSKGFHPNKIIPPKG